MMVILEFGIMVLIVAAPCRTQLRHRLLRHRLDIQEESSERIPPEKEERRQRVEAGVEAGEAEEARRLRH